ncbi:hypothetical protein [Ramlibacter albus]|uniref:Lipoprotein n=1 Tax=Ramlibacter albus TaxID=2079448 RepID=A0A923MFF3_9BURK|nr:hypothetical protein [Ramlibacter albus]MBC5768459.1 hypothetical protein [Ramlibacter albus]
MRAAALLLAAALCACSAERKLEPLPPADRIVITQYGKPEPGGELTDAQAVQRAWTLANALRQTAWAAEKVEHSSCGTVVLTFRAQGKPVGYLAIDGERFFTNAPDGEVVQPANPARMDEFLALLPRWYERSKCVG